MAMSFDGLLRFRTIGNIGDDNVRTLSCITLGYSEADSVDVGCPGDDGNLSE
jgi:hypothetical protein